MAGSTGGGNDEEIGNINITPMVDVMLVLLVIFMVTANFMKKESLNINLPKAAAADPNISKSTRISITKDGKVFLEEKETKLKNLHLSLSREAKLRPNMRVTLTADKTLPYGKITETMGIIRKSGISRIALSVQR